MFAPALDGLGGDVEFAGELVNSRIASGGSEAQAAARASSMRIGERVGEEFDERGEIGAEDFAGEGVVDVRAELNAGDADR